MQAPIRGKAFVLGDNIDTDQIIPAQYLSFNPSLPDERKFFGMYAMDGVPAGATTIDSLLELPDVLAGLGASGLPAETREPGGPNPRDDS